MRTRCFPVLLLCAWLPAACSRPPAPVRPLPPEPRDAQSAALGVSVSIQAQGAAPTAPDVVYFVRLDPDEPLEAAFDKQEVVASNHADGNRFFLLNAAPGSWVLVASAQEREIPGLAGRLAKKEPIAAGDSLRAGVSLDVGSRQKRTHRTYFSRAIVARSRVRLDPGAFVFMGELAADPSPWSSPDAAQLHARRVLEGDPGLRMGRSAATQPWLGGLGAWSRDAGAETDFLAAAGRALSRSGWAERLAPRRPASP